MHAAERIEETAMKRWILAAALCIGLGLVLMLAGCMGRREQEDGLQEETESSPMEKTENGPIEGTEEESINLETAYTADTPIEDVINDPVFGDYGRLIFPVDDWYYSGDIMPLP